MTLKRFAWVFVLAVVLSVGVYADGSLFLLAGTGTVEEVQLAIRRGANVNWRGEGGMTPLMGFAMLNPNPEVITALINVGVNVNARDEEGSSPLISAAIFNPNSEVITVLIDAGANVNARLDDGFTPLMIAVVFNKPSKVIALLLDAGANVNVWVEGITPLMWAAAKKPPEVIALLLDAGADGTLKDQAGRTAFDYAKENEALVGTDIYWRLNDGQY